MFPSRCSKRPRSLDQSHQHRESTSTIAVTRITISFHRSVAADRSCRMWMIFRCLEERQLHLPRKPCKLCDRVKSRTLEKQMISTEYPHLPQDRCNQQPCQHCCIVAAAYTLEFLSSVTHRKLAAPRPRCLGNLHLYR